MFNNSNMITQNFAQEIQNTSKDSERNELNNEDKETNVQDSTTRTKKCIKINTNKCRGELRLIKMIIAKREWKEIFDYNADIFWSGLNLPDEDWFIGLKTKINRIPGVTELSHKRTTAYFLNKFRKYFRDDYDFYPETFLIPHDMNSLKESYQANKSVLIAKPTAGSQGDGIHLISKLKDLDSFLRTSTLDSYKYIVQRYINNPLIIDGKKFDLRLYVLVSSVNPLIVYLNDEGLARFCTQNYEPTNDKNLSNVYMHLSNYSLNKNSKEYKFTEVTTEINDGSKRSMESFWKSYEKAGYNKANLVEEINELIRKFLTAMYPFLKYNYKLAFQDKDAKCFHILGFDIMIDDQFKPWLLEINANPSLSIEHDPNFVKEIDVSAVDYYVKEKVVEDAIEITLLSHDKQIEIGIGGNYNSYTQIMDGNPDNDMSVFVDLLEAFGKLSGYKFKGVISSTKFSKLANIEGFINDKVVRHDYDINYKKFCRGYNGMDFYSFITVMEDMAGKLHPGIEKLDALIKIAKSIVEDPNL
jgi:tubulin polyglutamylase TTLL11